MSRDYRRLLQHYLGVGEDNQQISHGKHLPKLPFTHILSVAGAEKKHS